MKSKRVITKKLLCIGTKVPDNGAKNLLTKFAMMASALVANVQYMIINTIIKKIDYK